MALWWLCSPESMPSICLVYGLAVASGGFEMNWPQHPKWNQPRKGARDAARHSRSRSQNSLNAETQRFAARPSRNLEAKPVLTQRRRGTRRNAEKKTSLRLSANLCASALILLSLVGTSIHHSSFILHHFRHPRFAPESRCFPRIAWPLGRCRPPTVLAMGQNRQKTGKTCPLPPSTSSGRMGPQ